MQTIKCPNCGFDADFKPGKFIRYPECGSKLKPQKSETNIFSGMDLSDLLSKAAKAERKSATPRDKGSAPGEPSKTPPFTERSNPAEEKPDMEFGRKSSDGDHHLEIEYNRNLFFLRGYSSVMRLRLTPCTNMLKGVMLFMETQGRTGRVLREIPVTALLQHGVPIEVRLSYTPEEVSGRAAFDFYVGCILGSETKCYQFTVEHKIYDPDLPSTTVRDININGPTITNSGPASDINIHGNNGDALNGIFSRFPTVHELIERMNDLPVDFVRQELRGTTWSPEKALIGGNPYPDDRLILEWNGKRLLLLGKKAVKLGRSMDPKFGNDLIVRMKEGGKEGPSRTVSRSHAVILYNGDSVQLIDKSCNGTYINDRRADGAGVPIPDNAMIEFGDIPFQVSLQVCRKRQSHFFCQTCDAQRIKSMTFVPKEGEPEYYLLVWECCELGQVIPELADSTVFFRNDTFFIRTPEQYFHYLRPGKTFKVNQQTITVNYFNQ